MLSIRQLSNIFFLSIIGWGSGILEVGLLNELTRNRKIIELLLIIIFYVILFADFSPAMFLVIWLCYLRGILTGSYVGLDIVIGLIFLGAFQLFREKVNSEERIFQITFSFLSMLIWIKFSFLVAGIKSAFSFLFLKALLNSFFAPFIFSSLKKVDAIITGRGEDGEYA